MNDKNFYKTFFKNYGILSAIIVSVFVLLFLTVKLSRKSWSENLRSSVESVLNDNMAGEWTVRNFIPLKSTISTNAAVYEIKNNKNSTSARAVIIRVPTFYGPMPVVYICDSEMNVTFAGCATVHGIIKRQFTQVGASRRIKYWQERVPYILAEGDK